VDPLTLAGQRAAALLPILQEQLQYRFTVVLVPRPDITEFPLQNFYRFVAPTGAGVATGADASAGASAGAGAADGAHSFTAPGSASARFAQLPLQHVLTVRMDIPEPWNVQSTEAVQDIDNLRCTPSMCGDPLPTSSSNSSSSSPEASTHTSVAYALKNILVAGQCFEAGPAGSSSKRMRQQQLPPNGLQLTLRDAATVDPSAASYSDTLVMQNLGYFQLQANPGLFVLNTAEGRATELYSLLGADAQVGTWVDVSDSAQPSAGSYVAVRSFEDVIHRLMVRKRRGKEHLALLGDEGDGEGEDEDATVQARAALGMKAKASSSRGSGGAGKEKKQQGSNAAAESGGKGSVWNSLFGSAQSKDADKAAVVKHEKEKEEEEDDRIHVFSLATGHMYERLVSTCMRCLDALSLFKTLFVYLFVCFTFCDLHYLSYLSQTPSVATDYTRSCAS
jgi:hypothetical protein